MQRHQRVGSARAGWLALVLVAVPSAAAAQRVLEFPLRTTAGADALVRGPVAVFWNPASVGLESGSGEAVIVDARGPSLTGLGAFALAATWALDPRTTLAVGYLYIGIDDIEQTTTSPLPEAGATTLIDVAENIFAAAVTRRAGDRMAVGAGVQYVRVAEAVGGRNVVEIELGATASLSLPLAPRAGMAARLDDDGVSWNAGLEIAPSVARAGAWALSAEWGLGGSPRFHGVAHRTAVNADWNDHIAISAGLAAEPDADGRTWNPLGSVSLRLARYSLAVLRENLPNDFGAVHSFRLGVTF